MSRLLGYFRCVDGSLNNIHAINDRDRYDQVIAKRTRLYREIMNYLSWKQFNQCINHSDWHKSNMGDRAKIVLKYVQNQKIRNKCFELNKLYITSK